MTNDLISRSAQHKHLLGPCVAKYPSSFTMGLLAAARELDAAPAVDAVEVVRCKDCDNMTFIADDPAQKPGMFCTLTMAEVGRNDFCSYGERRNDESGQGHSPRKD